MNKWSMTNYKSKNTCLKVIQISIFMARGEIWKSKLEKWGCKQNICGGCEIKDKTKWEFLSCPGIKEQNENKISYNLVYGNSLKETIRSQFVRKRLKTRWKIFEEKESAKKK